MYCGVPQRQQLAPIRQDNRIIEPHSSVGKLNQLCELSTIGGIEHETALVLVAARWHHLCANQSGVPDSPILGFYCVVHRLERMHATICRPVLQRCARGGGQGR